MRTFPLALLALFALCLAGCAAAPPVVPADHLFHDALFPPPAQPIRADEVFAPSEEMKRYLAAGELAEKVAEKGRSRALYEALYSKDLLKVEYDAVMTRNAAEAFAARSGNCLSLAIMTASLAKHMGLQVRYQAVIAEELWSRASGIYFASRHVNVTLGRRNTDPKHHYGERDLLTIDFTQVGELQKQYAWEIPESAVVAMYMNNRAAEVLAAGDASQAYWFVREALRHDPGYMTAFNTLGVIYRRLGHAREAEAALLHVLAMEPKNTHALANLALVYSDQGRHADAEAATARLARLQPEPPFHNFERGMAALRRNDYETAKVLFLRELDRDPAYHEFHFGLAAAYAGMGEPALARKHLEVAIANSPGGPQQSIYAAKLARLK